jgi:hypothetical protein
MFISDATEYLEEKIFDHVFKLTAPSVENCVVIILKLK